MPIFELYISKWARPKVSLFVFCFSNGYILKFSFFFLIFWVLHVTYPRINQFELLVVLFFTSCEIFSNLKKFRKKR